MAVRRVRTVFTGVAGTPWYCNMHFRDELGVDAQEMIYTAATFWSLLKGHVCDAVSYEVEADVPSFDIATGALTDVDTGVAAGDAGGATGDPLPWQVQAQITVRTGLVVNNRRVQGRILIPGLTVDDSQTGTGPNSTTLGSTINAAVEALTINDNFVIWHKPVNGAGGQIAQPSSFALRNVWSTLRSRLI